MRIRLRFKIFIKLFKLKKIISFWFCQPRIDNIKEPLLIMKENVLYILKKFITFLSIIRLKIIIQQDFFKLHKKLLSNPNFR